MSVIEELRPVVVHVDAVPRCALVHLQVGDVGGLVLTVAEARALADDLRRACRRASGSARPRARKRVAAA